jgi:hypothetical protein
MKDMKKLKGNQNPKGSYHEGHEEVERKPRFEGRLTVKDMKQGLFRVRFPLQSLRALHGKFCSLAASCELHGSD